MIHKCKHLGMLLTILIFSFCSLTAHVNAKTEPRIPKNKIVALVYDDSRSMWEQTDKNGIKTPIDNWKYANYALQSFVALMDTQDQLKVVKTSSPAAPEQFELDEKIRQLGIDQIRGWKGKGNTPIASLQTAINELNKAADSYHHTDFWLVVLTDGIFNEINNVEYNISKNQIDKTKNDLFNSLKELKEKMRSKDVAFHAALIPIETYLTPEELNIMADFKRQWKESTEGMVLESNGQLDIIHRINEVAATMTNRDSGNQVQSDLNPVLEGNELILQSPFPLRRITILEQSVEEKESFQMKEFYVNNKRIEQGIEGPYKIKTADDRANLNPPIRGTLTHLKNVNGDAIIEQGTYKIVFDRDLTETQKKNIQVLAEPAIDFTINLKKINKNGSLTNDSSLYFQGSKMRIETNLIKSETSDEAIDLSRVDVSSLFKVEAQIDGKKVQLKYERKLNKFIGDFPLEKSGSNPIKVNVNVKGFYQKEKETILDGIPIRKMELRADTDSWNANLDGLDRATPFVVTPMINGEEISADELKKIYKNLKVESPGHIKIEKKMEGNKILIQPQSLWPIARTSTGEVPLGITLPGQYPNELAKGTFVLNIKDISFWEKYGKISLLLLLVLFLIWYLIGLIIKPRFDRNRIWIEYKQVRGGRNNAAPSRILDFNGSWAKRWLIPYAAERKTINDLTFKAHKKKDRVTLVKECQKPEYFVQYRILEDESNKKDIAIMNNDLIKFTRGAYELSYLFRTR